jgi:transposase
VFGILERNGKVKVEIAKDVSAETLLRETIKKVKRGSLIYTDKFKSYDGLVMYGFKHVYHCIFYLFLRYISLLVL